MVTVNTASSCFVCEIPKSPSSGYLGKLFGEMPGPIFSSSFVFQIIALSSSSSFSYHHFALRIPSFLTLSMIRGKVIPKICKKEPGKSFYCLILVLPTRKQKCHFLFFAFDLDFNPECGPEACAFRLTCAWLWVNFFGGGSNFNSFDFFFFLEELSQCTPFRPLG